MKKILTLLMAVLLCSFLFCACGESDSDDFEEDREEKDPKPPHTCVYDQKNENDAFLKNEASCTLRKTYYFSCQCGKAGSETFSVGGYKHVLENGECIDCDYRESVGLAMATYNNSKEYEVSGEGSCADRHVVIPAYYNDLPVTYVRFSSSYSWKESETVTVPNTVSQLYFSDEAGCFSRIYFQGSIKEWMNIDIGGGLPVGVEVYISGELITDLAIPEGIEKIGSYTFQNWRWLESIHIAASVTEISDEAFRGCHGHLKSITVAEDNAVYRSAGNCLLGGEELVLGCNTSVIPDDGSVKVIGSYAFENCESLRDVTLPSSVTTIKGRAFEECHGLEKIVGINVVYVNSAAFRLTLTDNSYTLYPKSYVFAENCSFGKDISSSPVVPTDAVQIGDYLFRVVDGIPTLVGYVGTATELTLPSDYEGGSYVIGEKAFYNNDKLYRVIISDAVTAVGAKAFSECDFLFWVVLGSGLTEIADDAFVASYRLVEVYNRSSLTVDLSTYGLAQAIHIYDNADGSLLYFDNEGYVFYLDYYHTYLLGYVGDDIYLNLPEAVPSSPTGLQSNQAKLYYSVHDYAFYGCDNIVSVDLPACALFLGKYAFYRCISLENIVFNGSLMGIGDYALYNCYALKVLHLPASVANVGKDAFVLDDMVAFYFDGTLDDWAQINFSSSVVGTDTYKRYKAYIDGEKIASHQNITLSDKTTMIGSYAFANWSWVKNLDTGNGVQSIGEYAFRGIYLRTVILGTKVLTIYNDAFPSVDIVFDFAGLNIVKGEREENGRIGEEADIVSRQSPLVKGDFAFAIDTDGAYYLIAYTGTACDVVLPDDCDGNDYVVYKETFAGKHITSVKIGSGVTEIGEHAFSRCSDLKDLSYAADGKLTAIGECAFLGCGSLTTIVIPSGLTHVGGYVFALAEGTYMEEHVKTTVNVYIEDVATWMNLLSQTGPYSFFQYRDYVINFYKNGELVTELVIPEGTTVIPSGAFRNCVSLKSVTIPEGVINIGDFAGCIGLTTLTIPDGVTAIDSGAFRDCTGLKSITLPDSITSIGDDAFDGCVDLMQEEGGVYYVGKWAVACEEGITSVTLRSDTVGIAACAFSWSDLTSVVIPDSVLYIGKDAFRSCDCLEMVTLDEGSRLTVIGDGAFESCSALIGIRIPASVTTIGRYAFDSCYSLENVTIDAGSQLTGILSHTFHDCYALKSITIPASVITIAEDAFKYSGLTSAVFEDAEGWGRYKDSIHGFFDYFDFDVSNPSTAARNLVSGYTWVKK